MADDSRTTTHVYAVRGSDERPEWWLVCAYHNEDTAKAHAAEAARRTGDAYDVIKLPVYTSAPGWSVLV